MHTKATIASVLLAVSQVTAFTNGSLVPSYICNPNPDGLPKAFSQVLPYTRKQAKTVAFDANKGDNDNNVPQVKTAGAGTTSVGNSAYILASFHDTLNSLNAIQGNSMQVTLTQGASIVPGQANQLTLSSGNKNQALLGVLAYANDATGARAGSFQDNGGAGTFVQFAGCGQNAQGQNNAVIQQQGVSATATYTGLVYNAPANAAGSITLQGLSVSQGGFGSWNFTFPVAAAAGTAAGAGAGTAAGAAGATSASGAASAAGGTAATAAAKGAGTSAGSKAAGAAGTAAAPCKKGHKKAKKSRKFVA